MVDSNALEITQGNSAVIDITPLDGETGNPIRLNDGEKVLFTIKTPMGHFKLQKTLTNADYDNQEDDSLNCVLEPDDTIDWGSGTYLYDCLLITQTEAITFISSTFTVKKALGKYTDAR